MQVHITSRHIELTPKLADFVEKRLGRVARHFNAVLRAHVILDGQKDRRIAEVVVHSAGRPDFRAKGEAGDLLAAVDMVAEKLHQHMARQKDRRVRGRRGAVSRHLVPAPEELPLLLESSSTSEEPRLTRVSRFTAHPMTVAEAVEELEGKKHGFTVFMHDDQIAVIYKRQDGSYGLLEPNIP